MARRSRGGVVGLASYELGDRIERLLDSPACVGGRTSVVRPATETLLAFDHHRREVLAIGPGAADALSWLGGVHETRPLRCQVPLPPIFRPPILCVTRRPSPQWWRASPRARSSRPTWRDPGTASWPQVGEPFDLFQRLAGAKRRAAFAAYLRLPGLALVSNSPERFLRVTPWRPGG